MDIEPLKALSDRHTDDKYNTLSSVDGEVFGNRLAYALAIAIFFLFCIGAMKG